MEIVFQGGEKLLTSSTFDSWELIDRLSRITDHKSEWFVSVELDDGRKAWVNPDFVAYVI